MVGICRGRGNTPLASCAAAAPHATPSMPRTSHRGGISITKENQSPSLRRRRQPPRTRTARLIDVEWLLQRGENSKSKAPTRHRWALDASQTPVHHPKLSLNTSSAADCGTTGSVWPLPLPQWPFVFLRQIAAAGAERAGRHHSGAPTSAALTNGDRRGEEPVGPVLARGTQLPAGSRCA